MVFEPVYWGSYLLDLAVRIQGRRQRRARNHPSETALHPVLKFNPQKNKTIVFAEVGVGIVSINSDGTGRQILLNDGYASEPVYTPDGKQIVYAGSPAGNPKYDLYIMKADGSKTPEADE